MSIVDDLLEQLSAAIESGDEAKAAELRRRLDDLTNRKEHR